MKEGDNSTQSAQFPFRWGAVTDPGKVRGENQDALLVRPEAGLFMVADGMGGAHAGALASQAVIKVLPQMIEEKLVHLKKPSEKAVRLSLRDAILKLSQQLRKQSADQVGLKGMGATVVLALLRDRQAFIAHMGDSRAYLFRGGKLQLLTQDHSIVGILLRHGDISAKEAKNHPARGRLSRYVGMDGEVYPDVRAVALKGGDRLLLCTDGLTAMISDKDIEGVLKKNPNPQHACQSLIAAANKAGGDDNITVVVVDWA